MYNTQCILTLRPKYFLPVRQFTASFRPPPPLICHQWQLARVMISTSNFGQNGATVRRHYGTDERAWFGIELVRNHQHRSISRVMTSSDFLHFRSIQIEVKRLRVISDHWSLQVAYFISGLKTSRSRWDSAWSEIGLTIQAGWDPESINFRIKISNKSHRVIQPLRRNPYATMQSFQHLKEINFQFKTKFFLPILLQMICFLIDMSNWWQLCSHHFIASVV